MLKDYGMGHFFFCWCLYGLGAEVVQKIGIADREPTMLVCKPMYGWQEAAGATGAAGSTGLTGLAGAAQNMGVEFVNVYFYKFVLSSLTSP